MPDYVVAGLGNPGERYAGNRHNVGAWCVNRLARRHHAEMRASKTMHSAGVTIDGASVLLMRPRTWVNTSGDAIGPLVKRLKLPAERLIVVYDELDLPEGRIRIRSRGSDGGHNGLKSIIAATGSGDFGRVRIGIGRPDADGRPSWEPGIVARHVLNNPTKESKEVLEAAVDRACDAVEAIIIDGYERAMNRFNAADALNTTQP